MAKSQRRKIDLLGNTVEYDVRRSSDATKPRIDVDIHGVTVVIPESEAVQPAELLKENAAWVVDKQRTYDAYRAQVPDRTFEAGERFPYLGDEYELVIEPRSNHTVAEGSIRLRQSSVEQSSVERVLENFYRKRARQRFTDRADYYANEMGVEYERIEIRNQRTKWGSCSTTGTLGLNWRLMMAPPEVIDYVVVHELAHLEVQSHSDEFWRLVGEHMPDYGSRTNWLNENSTKLVFTEDDL